MANSIAFTLPGFPLLNQRVEVSNANDDCVFTSSASIVRYLTGNKTITGSDLKAMDSDYGASYTGFASESKIVDTLAKLGVKMVQVQKPAQQGLLDELHWQIEHYHQPCIITMPSQWNSAPLDPATGKLRAGWNPRTYSGYSHVGVMVGSGTGYLRCMNPWGGFYQDQPDSWWAQRLLTGSIWVASKLPAVIAVATKPVPALAPVAAATSAPAPAPAPLTDAEKLSMIAHILAS